MYRDEHFMMACMASMAFAEPSVLGINSWVQFPSWIKDHQSDGGSESLLSTVSQDHRCEGVGEFLQGRLVAIDATVQRRPPGGLVSAEDAACNRLTELALNDAEVCFPTYVLLFWLCYACCAEYAVLCMLCCTCCAVHSV